MLAGNRASVKQLNSEIVKSMKRTGLPPLGLGRDCKRMLIEARQQDKYLKQTMCKRGTKAAYLSHHLVSIYIIYGMQAQSGKIIPFFKRNQRSRFLCEISQSLKHSKGPNKTCLSAKFEPQLPLAQRHVSQTEAQG